MDKVYRFPEWVFHYDKTDSTMSDAINIISEITPPPDNFVIIADEQIKGIGRNNNTWISPLGGLWFTYCLKSQSVKHQVTIILGLYLHKILTKHYPSLAQRLLIKWPNDIVIDGRKLSGILVQAHSGYLCIGIGINTNIDELILNEGMEPISLKQIFSFQVSDSSLAKSFVASFQEVCKVFTEINLSDYVTQINNLLYGFNHRIKFDTGKDLLEGICRGISDEGTILIEDNEGIICPYYSGSIVSFGD